MATTSAYTTCNSFNPHILVSEHPIISVVIPCYNQGMFIAETLDSVIAQTWQRWEAIIVDDGSTDNLKEQVLCYQRKDPRIHYYYQPNGGVSKARNHGISLSKGKYILPLDGDDTIAPTYLEKAVTYLDAHTECTLFYCHADMFGDSNEDWGIEYKSYESLLLFNSIFCSSVFRKKDFEKVGGYDESFLTGFEDWEFYIRLLADGGIVYQHADILFHYRQHNSLQQSRTTDANQREEALLAIIYEKHKSIYDRYFPSPLVLLREVARRNRPPVYDHPIEAMLSQHDDFQQTLSQLQADHIHLSDQYSQLQQQYRHAETRESVYLSYPCIKILYKLIRAYRKHIRKESLY